MKTFGMPSLILKGLAAGIPPNCESRAKAEEKPKAEAKPKTEAKPKAEAKFNVHAKRP